MEKSTIAEFYNERSVFITGGTGFLGKVLVEKLLRSCPGIKTLYLLIRPKSGVDIRTRLLDFTQHMVGLFTAHAKMYNIGKHLQYCTNH